MKALAEDAERLLTSVMINSLIKLDDFYASAILGLKDAPDSYSTQSQATSCFLLMYCWQSRVLKRTRDGMYILYNGKVKQRNGNTFSFARETTYYHEQLTDSSQTRNITEQQQMEDIWNKLGSYIKDKELYY